MKSFKITSNQGIDFGAFPAETPLGALDKLAQEAGCADHAAACAALDSSTNDWTTDGFAFKAGTIGLLVVEVVIDPTECARVELARVQVAVTSDPRYERGVEGSFRRVALALVGHNCDELAAACDGTIWELTPGQTTTAHHYLPERVPATVARLVAIGPDPDLADATSDAEIHARICARHRGSK